VTLFVHRASSLTEVTPIIHPKRHGFVMDNRNDAKMTLSSDLQFSGNSTGCLPLKEKPDLAAFAPFWPATSVLETASCSSEKTALLHHATCYAVNQQMSQSLVSMCPF